MTKIDFHIKKSRFNVKSRFKESKCADEGHSLNWDFTVLTFSRLGPVETQDLFAHSDRSADFVTDPQRRLGHFGDDDVAFGQQPDVSVVDPAIAPGMFAAGFGDVGVAHEFGQHGLAEASLDDVDDPGVEPDVASAGSNAAAKIHFIHFPEKKDELDLLLLEEVPYK